MAERDFTNGLDTPREILCSIYHQYGESILEDPRQFQALFKDLSKGQFIREMNLIKQSFSENIPSDLYRKRNQIPFQMLGPQLVKHLHESLGMEMRLAEWLVDSWAIAFDIIQENPPISEKPSSKPAKKTAGTKPTAQPKKTSAIHFTSNPSGGTVFLGRAKLGVTPITVTISNAQHNFKCRFDGYEDDRKSLSITQDSTVNFNLKRRTESIFVATRPTGAAISLDGQHAGYSPLTIPDVSHGPHRLTCSMADYQTVDKNIDVPTDVKFDIFLDLAPRLTITSSPLGATILIDGKYMGITPVSITYISDGNYKIETNLKGYENQTEKIRLPKDSTVHFNLVKISAPSQKTYPLSITTHPDGAMISLDGKQMGKSPQKIFLLNGFYNLRCSLTGYDDCIQQVKIPQDTDVNFTLINNASSQKNKLPPIQRIDFLSEQDPVIPTLNLVTTPKNAKVFLDGIYRGVSPLSIPNLPEGTYNLKCSFDGFEDLTRSITIPTDLYLNLRLKKLGKTQSASAPLFITSSPPGAEILVDGNYEGITPRSISHLSDGNYIIETRLKGYENQSTIISFPNISTINFDLVKKSAAPQNTYPYPVSITTYPSGAVISVDGKEIGRSPLRISLTNGSYDLNCSMNGYDEVIRQISIPQDIKMHFNLVKEKTITQPTHAPLFVTSNPSGAEIYLDGKKVGTTPYDIPKVPFGSHNLLLYLSGYDPAKQTLEVPKNRRISLNLKQKSSSGGSNPVQTPVQNSPAAPSQKVSVKNNGLYYWLLFSLGLLVAGLIFLGFFSGTISAPTTVTAVGVNSVVAAVPPVVNQTDTMSLQSGISLLNVGNYAEALKEFESVIATNPQSAAAWNYKSFSLFKLGRYNESIQASDETIALDQNYTAAWTTKGYNLNLLERYNEAVPVFDHAISLNPNDADPWIGRGISYFSLNNYTAAVVSFDRAITLAPTEKNAWNYKGKSLQALNKYSEAVAAYDSSLKINPGDVQILLNKGDCLNALKDYQNASSIFNSVLTNDPKNTRALTGVGTAFLNQGKYQDALKSFEDALSEDPNYVDALVGKSRALLNLKNSFDSLQIANKALELDPQNSAAWICKADTWALQSKYSDASQAYDQALKITPNSMDALMGKADVLVKVEDYDGAISILDKALTISPDNKDLWNEKGYALMKKGENSNAEIALNKAIELDPKFVQAWSNKGYALSGAGSLNQSIQAFDKAIELNPNFKDAWLGKSIVYTKLGDFKASEAAAQQAMQIKQ